jgi:hypothetical protein
LGYGCTNWLTFAGCLRDFGEEKDKEGYTKSDIDLFIVGITDQKKANEKVHDSTES